MCQHEETNEIQKQLNEDFSNVCDWFVEKKLSMYFSEDEIKSIHFDSKFKRKIVKKLNTNYGDIQIEQHSKIKYLGYLLDKTMSTASWNFFNHNFLTLALRCLLYNDLRQHHFDHACSAWYPNLTVSISMNNALNIRMKSLTSLQGVIKSIFSCSKANTGQSALSYVSLIYSLVLHTQAFKKS